jgi:hypothetical protein
MQLDVTAVSVDEAWISDWAVLHEPLSLTVAPGQHSLAVRAKDKGPVSRRRGCGRRAARAPSAPSPTPVRAWPSRTSGTTPRRSPTCADDPPRADQAVAVALGQRHDLDARARVWRMDHPAAADVHADVTETAEEE